MFWVYVVGLFFPPIVLQRAIVRRLGDSDDDDGSFIAPIIIFVLQAVLLIIGGWVAATIAVLIFAYACLLAYAMWGPDGKKENFKRAAPLPADWKTRLDFVSNGVSHEDEWQPSKPEHRKAKVKTKTGRDLDVIRFSYLNQKGEFSSRRVKVTRIAQQSFDGTDLDIIERRTFRYESVIGDITSEKTGEVLDLETWAAEIRAQA